MVLATARKPEGGFQFISVAQLCAVWSAYETRRIRLPDVRLWCAAQEMVARRCQLTARQQPVYRLEEWAVLTGRQGGVSASLARLHQAGLLTWTDTALTFPSPPIKACSPLETMLQLISNHRRRIPVPRRLLRFLAKGCSRVMLATILGHLVRCLYYRQGQCRAEGFCKASWIAEIFGVSSRAVKTARQRLETLGIFQRIDTPQWVRNRYGQKMAINLRWAGNAAAIAAISPSSPSVAPPPTEETAQPAPLDSDKKLPLERKYQEPATGGPSGVLSTLFAQARECLRNGTTLLPASMPTPTPTPPVTTSQPRRSLATLLPHPLRLPRLKSILLEDLQQLPRLLILYTEAVQTQLIGASEADRLAFVALAQHVLHFQPHNPGGLFLWLLTHHRFAVITQAEEDQARARLATFLYADSKTQRTRRAA